MGFYDRPVVPSDITFSVPVHGQVAWVTQNLDVLAVAEDRNNLGRQWRTGDEMRCEPVRTPFELTSDDSRVQVVDPTELEIDVHHRIGTLYDAVATTLRMLSHEEWKGGQHDRYRWELDRQRAIIAALRTLTSVPV